MQFPDYETHSVTQLKTQKKNMKIVADFKTNIAGNTQLKIYCVTQLKSHRHTMLQKET